ncbi:hypothetical protein HWI79_632 [Cryptosporidium felis]|nr:hypothetical protein HWI79_632 [Cryptosporidium felis]
MTKKDSRNSLRASIETASSVVGFGENGDTTPNGKAKCIKKELDIEQNMIEGFKPRAANYLRRKDLKNIKRYCMNQ